MNIKEALATLDPADDAHWTSDGMPRMDVLQKLTRAPDLSRTQVVNAAPDFSRAWVRAAEAPEPEDGNVDSSAETDQEAAAPAEVMTPALEPDVVAVEADVVIEAGGSHEAPEIATTAPETATPAPTTKLEALKAQLEVYTGAMNDAGQLKDDAAKALRSASDQVNAINRQIDGLEKKDPQIATRDLRNYITMQHRIRLERAGRARRFMGDSGARPQDVAKALEVRSPLDKAFAGRKPPRGTVRPEARTVMPDPRSA